MFGPTRFSSLHLRIAGRLSGHWIDLIGICCSGLLIRCSRSKRIDDPDEFISQLRELPNHSTTTTLKRNGVRLQPLLSRLCLASPTGPTAVCLPTTLGSSSTQLLSV